VRITTRRPANSGSHARGVPTEASRATLGTMELEQAILGRRSVRGFLPREVPDPTLARIFERAQRAPSWCNIQPWRAWVASGEVRARYLAELTLAAETSLPSPDVAFPGSYPPPYDALRRQCGKALYDAMGVARDDGPARRAAWMRNFAAFDAPHVAIVGIDARFALYAAIDVGCWLESVLLLAHAEGIATCPQASLATYPDVARRVLGIPHGIHLLFGIAIGYEDPDAPANRCRTDRDPLASNVALLR
jgi:nitroreductase